MTNPKKIENALKALSGPRLAFLAFIVAGGYYLWTEHQAHLMAALPYLILLLCPLMHIFMHRGHDGHRRDEEEKTHTHETH